LRCSRTGGGYGNRLGEGGKRGGQRESTTEAVQDEGLGTIQVEHLGEVPPLGAACCGDVCGPGSERCEEEAFGRLRIVIRSNQTVPRRDAGLLQRVVQIAENAGYASENKGKEAGEGGARTGPRRSERAARKAPCGGWDGYHLGAAASAQGGS